VRCYYTVLKPVLLMATSIAARPVAVAASVAVVAVAAIAAVAAYVRAVEQIVTDEELLEIYKKTGGQTGHRKARGRGRERRTQARTWPRTETSATARAGQRPNGRRVPDMVLVLIKWKALHEQTHEPP
jgi:hypothetical protein